MYVLNNAGVAIDVTVVESGDKNSAPFIEVTFGPRDGDLEPSPQNVTRIDVGQIYTADLGIRFTQAPGTGDFNFIVNFNAEAVEGQPTIWVGDIGGNIVTMDPNTGIGTPFSSLSDIGVVVGQTIGLAFDSVQHTIYEADRGANKFYTVDPDTGASAFFVNTLSTAQGLAFDSDAGPNGTLYAVDENTESLEHYDPITGARTATFPLSTGSHHHGLGFDQVNNILYGSGQISTGGSGIEMIDPSTGTTTLLGKTNGFYEDVEFDPARNALLGAKGDGIWEIGLTPDALGFLPEVQIATLADLGIGFASGIAIGVLNGASANSASAAAGTSPQAGTSPVPNTDVASGGSSSQLDASPVPNGDDVAVNQDSALDAAPGDAVPGGSSSQLDE